MTTVDIRGARELEALLRELPDRLARSVVTGGLRAGATVIARAAKEKAPEDTGSLKSKIGVGRPRTVDGKRSVPVAVKGGVIRAVPKDRKKARKIVPARTAHLVEFGSERLPARPFMRPALDEAGPRAIARIAEVMSRGVDREARALASGKKSFRTGRRI